MKRSTPLPPQLASGPFAVDRAHAFGVGTGRLRGADLSAPFHGVRLPGAGFGSVEEQCLAYGLRMAATHFFSHETAARLWGAPLPTRFAASDPVHVCSLTRDRIRGNGVAGHQPRDRHIRRVQVGGLPVADVGSTWCQLASILSLDDLIVAGDYFAHVPVYPDRSAVVQRPYVLLDDLVDRVRRFRGPGKQVLRHAVQLVRTGAESPTETRLRLLIVRSGLPEPQLNARITDSRGVEIARGDLYYPHWRVLIEYDGDQHRTNTDTYERDMTRAAHLRAAGVEHIRVRMAGLFTHPAHTIAHLRRALLAAGWQP